ncbi:MAG: tetratricopeptide repeat protein [Candidatus Competibacteraceae bacterium]|nr:tetratricopeptide repeat protein [Candidatus Competibacteraceae bacterium]
MSGKQPRADSSSKALAEAIQLHRQGQLDAAETLYRQTLARNPRQIDALHFLGVLLSQRGRHSEGAESIRRALDIDPNYADAWNNLGNVRAGMDRWDEAAEAYQRTSELAPDNASARCNLGVMLLRSQRFGEAAAAFQQAIVLAPSLIEAHFNLGKALSAKGRYDEAIAAYQEVIRLQPTHAMAYRSRGILLYRLERSDEAAAMFRDWLALDPANPVAKHMLAAHSKQDVPERAADNYVQQLFDGMADSFDDHLHRLEYRAPELVAAAVVTRVGRPEAAFNVLDAGCGTGLCGPSLRPYARRLVGVDLSPRMVERARSRGDYDEVAIAELTAFLIDRPAAYDLIVSADTLVYFGQLEPVLTATAAALRPEGWLAFTVEQVAEQDAPAGFDLDSSGRYQHSEAYLRRVLAQVGLLVESLDGVMLRLEAGRYVNGFLVMARKPALRTDDQNSEEQFD